MRLPLLRGLMILDAVVLLLLGALLVFVPSQIERAFHFKDLPPAVNYLLAMWGCGLITLGFGYFVAARHPLRNVVWVQIGIARGLLECALGLVCLSRGIVTFPQMGFGSFLAGTLAVAYLALYPRGPRIVQSPAATAPPAASTP